MKRMSLCVVLLLLAAAPLFAGALGSSTRAVIPADVQQIISVDYRALKDSPTAMALKERVLPDSLKEFEGALRGVGVNPDSDVDQLTFASFRTGKEGLRIVGIAQGQFSVNQILKRVQAKKIKALKYHLADLYPMAGGMDMTFLDDSTLLFGARPAVKTALDTRDGAGQRLDSNAQVKDMISAVESGPIWSVLDQAGTQNMVRSTLGDAAKLADYNVVRDRLLGSRYTMTFDNGVNFDLDVVTSDSFTAASLSSLLKAGVLFRKATASEVEKTALEAVSVDSESSNLRLHFRTDEKRFQALLKSDLFAAVSH
jgi:hypothetical protein